MIPRAVVQLREAQNPGVQRRVLSEMAVEILGILLPRRLQENHADVDSLREAVKTDTDTAMACAHYVYKLAGFGRMLWLWHDEIDQCLWKADDARQLETTWWQKQAGKPVPSGPPPRDRRTPDTDTARRIEEFRARMEEAGQRKVLVADLVAYCGYTDPTQFQRVQREDPKASDEAKDTVERMLKETDPEKFWQVVETNRKKFRQRK
jgi:hypothetical protein